MYSTVSKNNSDINDNAQGKTNASRKVLNFFDHTGKEISHAKESVAAHIQKKPLTSTFIALGTGAVIGALILGALRLGR